MFIPSCLQLVCIESSLILNPHRLLSGKWSGNVLSSFIWLKVLFSFNLFSTYRTLLNRFLLEKKKTQTDLNWTWHFGCCLRFFFNLLNFFFPFSLALHATCYMLLFLSTYVTEREEKARADSTETEGGEDKASHDGRCNCIPDNGAH